MRASKDLHGNLHAAAVAGAALGDEDVIVLATRRLRRVSRLSPAPAWAAGVVFAAMSGCGAVGDSAHGASACNDLDGNHYIEDVLVDRLPKGTLEAYRNTGADCDDLRTGSIAAGWSATAHPAEVVDLLVRDGWTRFDPPGGAPQWYVNDKRAGDPVGRCLTRYPGPWQGGADWYPNRSCSHPSTEQIVLTAERGPRLFAARFGPYGMTVDAVHKKDKRGVRLIAAGQLPDSENPTATMGPGPAS